MGRKPDTPSPAADPDRPDRQERVERLLDLMREGLGEIRDILEEEMGNRPPRRLS